MVIRTACPITIFYQKSRMLFGGYSQVVSLSFSWNYMLHERCAVSTRILLLGLKPEEAAVAHHTIATRHQRIAEHPLAARHSLFHSRALKNPQSRIFE